MSLFLIVDDLQHYSPCLYAAQETPQCGITTNPFISFRTAMITIPLQREGIALFFTKPPPPKLSFQRVSYTREALTGLSCERPACRNRHVFAPLHPREGLTAFPERKFPRVFACVFCPEKLPFSCRKALPGIRRGRFRNATTAPLHCHKGLTAEQGRPYSPIITD